MTKPKKRKTQKPTSKMLLEELQQKVKQKEEYLGCCEYSVEQFEANRSNNLVNNEFADSSKFCRWYLDSQKQYFELHRSDYTASCKCVKAPQEEKIEVGTLLVDSFVCTKESKKIVLKQCDKSSSQLEESEQDTSQCSKEFKENVQNECMETSSQFENTQKVTSQCSEEFEEIVEKECVNTSSQLEESEQDTSQCSDEFKKNVENECMETSSQFENTQKFTSQCSEEFEEINEKECVETSSQLEESKQSHCSEEFKEIGQNMEVNVCELNNGEGVTTKDEKSNVSETVSSVLESMVDTLENDEKI